MVDQKVGTIRLAKALLAELEAAPDQVDNDHGASFVAVFAAVNKFITALDGAADDDSPFILGDGDMARLFNEFLERRGKSGELGHVILDANQPGIIRQIQAMMSH
jgi:hypothetical protein